MGLQASSQPITGFLVFTVWAKANYIVHRKSTAEAGVPVVPTTANYFQWWCRNTLSHNWSEITNLFHVDAVLPSDRNYLCQLQCPARFTVVGMKETIAESIWDEIFGSPWIFSLRKLNAAERQTPVGELMSEYSTEKLFFCLLPAFFCLKNHPIFLF